MSALKRFERYISAFFKLGRTSRLAKSAAHSVGILEPRIDALSDDLLDMAERQARLDGVPDHLEGHSSELADLRHAIGDGGAESLSAQLGAVAREVERMRTGVEVALGAGLESEGTHGGSSVLQRLSELEAHVRGLADDLSGRLAAVEARLDRDVVPGLRALAERSDAFDARLGELDQRLGQAVGDAAQTRRAYGEVSRRLDLMRFGGAEGDMVVPEGPPSREGLDALLDAFYGRLEDRYRGSREDIKSRLAVYLPDVRRAAEAAVGKPVLDLGCGRGEWVELLGEHGIAAEGVDLNPIQIAEAEAAGLAVRQGDALKALAEAPDGAFAAVTAHHLVEHLPFETVSWMTREALRVLAPGGVLIYETPNARNLIVGATTFHIDPTHVRPVVAEVLTTLADTLGYHPVEVRPLHPSETRDAFISAKRADPHIAELLFGPQDLAMLATKPLLRI